MKSLLKHHVLGKKGQGSLRSFEVSFLSKGLSMCVWLSFLEHTGYSKGINVYFERLLRGFGPIFQEQIYICYIIPSCLLCNNFNKTFFGKVPLLLQVNNILFYVWFIFVWIQLNIQIINLVLSKKSEVLRPRIVVGSYLKK